MKCPYCGGEMQHGNITGSKMLRLAPPSDAPKNLHRIGVGDEAAGIKNSGLAPWIPADYCRSCKKVIFDADII